MSSLRDIRNLVDLSGVDSRNIELIVKKAIEYVEIIRSEGLEVIGISFIKIPSSEPGAITLILSREGKGKEKRRYSPPHSYKQQLTIACFLFAIAKYSNIGNKAHILCSNSRNRGDIQNSISTKHPKSKLQENLTQFLEDSNLVGKYREMTAKNLPEELSAVQRQLIKRTTSGSISASSLSEIRKSFDCNEIKIFMEWKKMELIDGLDKSLVPSSIKFRKFSIHEVVDLIESEKMIRLKDSEIEYWKNKLFSTQRELDEIRKRSLWQRIRNK